MLAQATQLHGRGHAIAPFELLDITRALDNRSHSRAEVSYNSLIKQRLSTRPRAGIMAERSEAPARGGGRGLDHAQCCLRYAATARDPKA
jgi:hypothetical protein